MISAPRVLITRPQPQAGLLAKELAQAGWEPLIWPVLTIETTAPPPDLAGRQAALLTSANAARRAGPANMPALCVGAQTAQAARKAGFNPVISAQGDVHALIALAAQRLDPAAGPLIHLRGRDAAGDLAGALRARGFLVETAILYAAIPAGPPAPGIARALRAGTVDLALFYSPRSAAQFASQNESLRADLGRTTALAISAAAAGRLRDCGFGRVEIAQRPDGAAMRAAIAQIAAPGAWREAPGAVTCRRQARE